MGTSNSYGGSGRRQTSFRHGYLDGGSASPVAHPAADKRTHILLGTSNAFSYLGLRRLRPPLLYCLPCLQSRINNGSLQLAATLHVSQHLAGRTVEASAVQLSRYVSTSSQAEAGRQLREWERLANQVHNWQAFCPGPLQMARVRRFDHSILGPLAGRPIERDLSSA